MGFGSVIVKLRKEQGISQTDVALKIGIHKNVLERYKRNKVYPSIEIARKIEDVDREHIFSIIDAFIAKRKIQSIL